MNDRPNDIHVATEGTCEWLLLHEKYQNWVRERGLLWISGKPGDGKSTLLKYATERFRSEHAEDTLKAATQQ